jgi:hypothetical protein
MIYVGIDDTDTLGGLGTKRLARLIVADLAADYRCALILRHQLLFDPRVPYTSKNSACAILLETESRDGTVIQDVAQRVRAGILSRFQAGSDPGLCVTCVVPDEVVQFGRCCQREVMVQHAARRLAERHGIWLEGLGGTDDGVIGALAAVGLAAAGDDGRVLQVRGMAEELSGWHSLSRLREFGVDEVRGHASGQLVTAGDVDVGKRLRPNYRGGRVVLYVEPDALDAATQNRWRAVRCT